MQESFYHMTLKLHLNQDFRIHERQCITCPGNLHI